MNYYKQFAEMLGLELDEEFSLVKPNGEKVNEDKCKITEDGILYQREKNGLWLSEPLITLYSLLNGSYKAVPKPWKPKEGDRYCYYSASNGLVNYARWDDLYGELILWKVGNCFKTEEEARIKGKEIMEKLRKEYEEA